MSDGTLTRQEELAPGEEVRTFIGVLPSNLGKWVLDPLPESHIDLVPETLGIVTGCSLRDITGVYTPATSALGAVMSREFKECQVFFSLPRRDDDEVICEGPCCRSVQEDPLQTDFFMVEFSGLPDGSNVVIFGSQLSSSRFHAADWWRVFRYQQSEVDALPTIFTVKLIVKEDRLVFGHSQMDGLLNCSKQVLNGVLRKHEKERVNDLRKAPFNGREELMWFDALALMNLMKEDTTAVAPA